MKRRGVNHARPRTKLIPTGYMASSRSVDGAWPSELVGAAVGVV